MCTIDVKITLFQSFCSPLYTAHLWTKYSNNDILKLYRAYHNTFELFLGVPKREYTSPIFAILNVRTCPGVIRNLVFRFMVRLKESSNSIIKAIYSSSIFYQSTIWKHWRSLLYTNVQDQECQNQSSATPVVFIFLGFYLCVICKCIQFNFYVF